MVQLLEDLNSPEELKLRKTEWATGYAKKKYIQGDGSAYINLNYTPNDDTEVYCEFEAGTITGMAYCLYGASSYFSAMSHSSKKWYVGYKATVNEVKVPATGRVFSTLNGDKAIINGKEYPITEGDKSWSGVNKITIFKMNGNINYTPAKAKIFRFKITEDDTVIMDLRASHNGTAYGLYDIINNTWYGNNGSGAFTGK